MADFFLKLRFSRGFLNIKLIHRKDQRSCAERDGRTLYFIVLELSGRIHPNTVILRGLLLMLYNSIRRKDQFAAWAGWRSENKISGLHFRGFFPKLQFLTIILILPKGTAKLRWGGVKNYIL